MIEFLIRKRTAVFTAALLIIFVGMTAYMNLPRESNPEIKQPWIFVNTVYPGVAPQEIESLISMPLEEELAGLEGVNKISSSSRQSISSIFVEFDADTEVETALRRVKDRIDTAKADLPSESEEPRVSEFSSTDWPVFIAVISHPEGVSRIDHQAGKLKESLKRLSGVLDVAISGDLKRELAIEIDPAKLHYYSLTLDDVAAAVRNENASIPGGMLKSDVRNFSLAVTGEITNPDDFNNIVVSDGPRTIRIRDLGHAAFSAAEPESLARLNGSPAITLEIKKRTGANVIDLSTAIRDHIDSQRESFPERTEIVYSHDASTYIKETIVDLENNMFSGFVLVLLMTLFFLGFRNSLFVSLAIPFSMLISFFVLQLAGITLNSIVLFSLIMSLGMLVDNGIVIVENIFRHAAMGKERVEAAIDGTKEVAGPIIASTITTCLAFLPIIFMPGIMGQFMSYMPLTVITVLGSSLFVALTINPVFCSRFMSISDREMRKMTEGSGLFSRLQNGYTGLLKAALRRPARVAVSSLLIVIAGIVLYALVGKEPVFFPAGDPPTAIIGIEARQGTPLEKTDELVRSIEKSVSGAATSMDHYQAIAGSSGGGSSHTASVRVEFAPYLEREPSGADSTEILKNALGSFPGARITFEEIDNGPPSGHPVSYKITGEEYPVIGGIAEQVEQILLEYPELKGVSCDYESSRPEISVEVDRGKAAFHGLSTAQIAMSVRNAFQGSSIGSFRQGSEEYDVNLRYRSSDRESINQLAGLMITSGSGTRIPLSSVAKISRGSAVGVIKRTNQERSVEVWADFKPDVQNKKEIKSEIDARLAALSVPSGYSLGTGEGLQIQEESSTFLAQAFMVALFMILIVLIAQFNSITDPAIIIFSVFLSMGGVFWGYALTGITFVVIMSGIGCIALAGVAVNNCIVLVDYTNLLIRDGMHWSEAVVEAGRTRLRPVLLTAITTVLGMIPMAMGVSFNVRALALQIGSEQSAFWQAFAWAMIFGLSFATVMTLIVVPVLLHLKFSILHRGQDQLLELIYSETREAEEEVDLIPERA